MAGHDTLKSDTTLTPAWQQPHGGVVRATMWPTRALSSRERWFDELYVWTEGFQASTMQRARLQVNALRKAFAMLELEYVDQICVTLSFGTVERALDHLTQQFDEHRLYTHRISIMLRGQIERLRSPYRVQSFVEWLRTQQVPVGYRVSASRIGMEMKAIDLLQPDFAKVSAPASMRLEYWQDAMLEARAAGLKSDWIIVSDLESAEQRKLARAAGFRFGQGSAIRHAYAPPSTRLARQGTLPGLSSSADSTDYPIDADS